MQNGLQQGETRLNRPVSETKDTLIGRVGNM